MVEGLPGTLGYFNCLSLFGVASFLCDPTCYFVVGIGYGPLSSVCLSGKPGFAGWDGHVRVAIVIVGVLFV